MDYKFIAGCGLEAVFVLSGLGILIAHGLRQKRHAGREPICRLPARPGWYADVIFFVAAFTVPMAISGAAAIFTAKTYPNLGVGPIQLGSIYVLEFAMIAAVVLYLKFWRPPDVGASGANLIRPFPQSVPVFGSGTDDPLWPHGTESAGELPPAAPVPAPPKPPAFRTGVITFLVAMPVLALVGLAWQSLLTLCHVAPAPQTIVDLFLGLETPLMKALFTIVAVILVPFNEEMIFRGGLFRGLRAALPRKYAILVSAVIFGVAHGDLTAGLPLITLGIVLAIAYERTGNIGTVIVAHALFNLNTLVALLLGVTP